MTWRRVKVVKASQSLANRLAGAGEKVLPAVETLNNYTNIVVKKTLKDAL